MIFKVLRLSKDCAVGGLEGELFSGGLFSLPLKVKMMCAGWF